jgi:hypothetical protein
LKIFQWTIGIIIVLPVVTGAYTNFAKLCKGERYIQDKIKTKVVVAKIDMGSKKIILEGVYFEGLKRIRYVPINLPLTSACFNCSITKLKLTLSI